MTRSVPFQAVVDALLEQDRPFPRAYLPRFSDLAQADLDTLFTAWPRLPQKRKSKLLENLRKLAQEDTLLSFDDLARPLLRDPDAPLRISAIRLLEECEDVRLVPLYLQIMETDSDAEARAAAATAVGQFIYLGELDKLPAPLQHEMEDRLLEAAQNAASAEVRRRALESLGFSSRPEVPALIEAACHSDSADWVVSALFAMGRSSDSRWEKLILSRLRSPTAAIRAEAARDAGELELASARRILLDQLEDEEQEEVRQEIIWALTKIGGEGVRDRLEELLEAEMDDAQADFLAGALDNLTFTEDLGGLDLVDFEPEDDGLHP